MTLKERLECLEREVENLRKADGRPYAACRSCFHTLLRIAKEEADRDALIGAYQRQAHSDAMLRAELARQVETLKQRVRELQELVCCQKDCQQRLSESTERG